MPYYNRITKKKYLNESTDNERNVLNIFFFENALL